MSQEKKLADYTTGTYFIHPKIIEEMRQIQRRKRQLASEQGKIPAEQLDFASQYVLDSEKLPAEQAKHVAPDLAVTPTSPTNMAPVQTTQP